MITKPASELKATIDQLALVYVGLKSKNNQEASSQMHDQSCNSD